MRQLAPAGHHPEVLQDLGGHKLLYSGEGTTMEAVPAQPGDCDVIPAKLVLGEGGGAGIQAES